MNRRYRVRRFLSCVLLTAILGAGSAGPASAQTTSTPKDTTPIYDVPYVAGIKIDGDAADWKDAGFRVEIMPDMNGRTEAKANFDPSFRLAWDERGLLVLVKVRDDIFVETADESSLWEKDSIEVFAAAERGTKEYYGLVISPGMTAEFPDMRVKPIDLRKNEQTALWHTKRCGRNRRTATFSSCCFRGQTSASVWLAEAFSHFRFT